MLDDATNELLASTGAGTPTGEFFRRFWMPCLLSKELPEPDCSPVQTRIMGEDLVAFRDTTGAVGIVDAYCAHRGAPLFFGRNEECGLRCVYHGWKFDRAGNCVDMPNEPAQSRFKERIKLKAYPIAESGGVIWTYMGPTDSPPPMPALEWLDVPLEHSYVSKSLGESNYLQALEGDHDSSHTSHLHSTLQNSVVGGAGRTEKLTQFHISGKAPRLMVLDTEYGILTGSRRDASPSTYLWRTTPWLMPFYSIISAEPGTPIILNARVPRDDESFWAFRVAYKLDSAFSDAERETLAHLSGRFSQLIEGSWRTAENMSNDYLIDRRVQRYATFTGIPNIPAQDRAVQEGMRPSSHGRRTVDRGLENLASADASIIKLRNRLLSAVRDLEGGREPELPWKPELYRVRAPTMELDRQMAFDAGLDQYMSDTAWNVGSGA